MLGGYCGNRGHTACTCEVRVGIDYKDKGATLKIETCPLARIRGYKVGDGKSESRTGIRVPATLSNRDSPQRRQRDRRDPKPLPL